jgi:hypothetical protein
MIFGGKFRALWNKIRQAQTSKISLLHLLFLQKQQNTLPPNFTYSAFC